MKTFIVLISVSNNDARKICENIENSKYSFDTEFDIEPTITMVRDKILEEYSDDVLEATLSVYEISDFMDDCNDELIIVNNYFMSYVYAEQKS